MLFHKKKNSPKRIKTDKPIQKLITVFYFYIPEYIYIYYKNIRNENKWEVE